MLDNHDWIEINGIGNAEDFTLLSLSKCGLCGIARDYLDFRGVSYRYLDLDTIPKEEKISIKTEFNEKFARRLSYPSLVMYGERVLVGFIRSQWDKAIPY